MPIFDQGYQHWDGKLSGHAWRWLAVARQGVRVQLRKRGTKWMVATAFAPALALAALLIVWGLLEQGSRLLDPIRFLLEGLPQEIRSGPRAYRNAFWTMAFSTFFNVQTFFAMIAVLTVGPDLISQDLRFNAMPLYFSKPLRRFDYFAGKLGVIGFFLLLVAVLPAVAAYLMGLAFSFELSVVRDTGRLFLASLGYGLVLTFSAGMLMLAFSSLSRNARMVGALFFGFWILSNFVSSALEDTIDRDRDDDHQPYWRVPEGEPASEPYWPPIVSYTRNLSRVREAMLGTVAARDQFLSLSVAAQDTARDAALRATPLGFLGRRGGAPAERPLPAPPPVLRLESDRFPWTWSAGVLTALFVLSVWILTTRVKSLDRLK